VAAIDASSFDRIAASSRYTRKTAYRIQSLKTTLPIDCVIGAILDVHCSVNNAHDVPIGELGLKRNIDNLSVVAADKGYDAGFICDLLREHDVPPLIKHRELSSIQQAHNARMDDELSNPRQISEAVSACSASATASLNSRSWYRQFREISIKAAFKNIDDTIEPCYACIWPSKQDPLIDMIEVLEFGFKPYCGSIPTRKLDFFNNR
jgi:IS5 family transposase